MARTRRQQTPEQRLRSQRDAARDELGRERITTRALRTKVRQLEEALENARKDALLVDEAKRLRDEASEIRVAAELLQRAHDRLKADARTEQETTRARIGELEAANDGLRSQLGATRQLLEAAERSRDKFLRQRDEARSQIGQPARSASTPDAPTQPANGPTKTVEVKRLEALVAKLKERLKRAGLAKAGAEKRAREEGVRRAAVEAERDAERRRVATFRAQAKERYEQLAAVQAMVQGEIRQRTEDAGGQVQTSGAVQ